MLECCAEHLEKLEDFIPVPSFDLKEEPDLAVESLKKVCFPLLSSLGQFFFSFEVPFGV